MRTDAALMVMADPPRLRGQRRQCWLGYHRLGETFPQNVPPCTLTTPTPAARRPSPPAGKVRRGISWQPVPVKTCFPSRAPANLRQRECLRPAPARGLPPPAAAAALEAAGPSEGFFHPLTGKVKILPGTTQGCTWKMLGCSACEFEQGK